MVSTAKQALNVILYSNLLIWFVDHWHSTSGITKWAL